MTKTERLEQIKADIIAQNICPNLAKTAKQLVFGHGNPNANIVFIGEAPGKKEDATGEPFVGAAGAFLNTMLASIQLIRSDTYITNIVKYRPPDNRDPSKEEKEAFMPFLFEQMDVIEPTIIVTLGRHSTACFIPDMQISDIHGQPMEVNVTASGITRQWTILPLYHPAAALYNGGLRITLLNDFQNILPFITKKQNL
jgi:uracil-DNA glycosylase